jgi:L-fuculose-phosphate aldolase
MKSIKELKAEIIEIGKRLYSLRLVAAKGGNLSSRIEGERILVTASGTCLGELRDDDIVEVELSQADSAKGLTTEFPLHRLIYQTFPVQKIIHCHPSLANAYFAVYNELKNITFENKLFLGQVPVVNQETPNISKPEEVVAALKTNNLAVIRRHGVVCIGETFKACFYLIEELEEAVRMAGLAKLLSKDELSLFEEEQKKNLQQGMQAYEMFSQEHILAIVSLINQDEKFLSQAKALDLTTQVAIKLDAVEKIYKFHFQQGKISKVDHNEDAPFVISGPAEVWRLIFEGKVDPFVATTQGKLKLKGDLAKLSRWYAPFTRMFALFREVKIA